MHNHIGGNRMKKCVICGKEYEGQPYMGEDICGSTECFRKNFWLEKVKWMEDGDRTREGICVRINGTHWHIDKQTDSVQRGCAGREYFVEFIVGPWAGKIFRTTNLWHQGEINYYKDQLIDNAIWRQREELHGKTVHQFNGWDGYGEPKYMDCVIE